MKTILIAVIFFITIISTVSAYAPVAHFYGNITSGYYPPPGAGSGETYPEMVGTYVYVADFDVVNSAADQTAELQEVFDYARDNSIVNVLFPSGWTIGVSDQVTQWEGLKVYGNGTTIRLVNGIDIDGNMWRVSDDAACYNLTFDGNLANASSSGIRLRTNAIFFGNEVKNVNDYTVAVYGDDNVYIANNTIHDGRQYGICTGGGVGGEAYNITVTNNTIYNMNVGIKIRGTDHGIITNNNVTLENVAGQFARGISLYSYDLENYDILIQDNKVTGNLGLGTSTGDGISSDDENNFDIVITENNVYTCDTGIDIWFNNGEIYDNYVQGSTACVSDNGAGNTVYGNTCAE